MRLLEGMTPLLTSEIIQKCKEAGVHTILDFVSSDCEILSKKISTSYKDVSSIQRLLLAYYGSLPRSGDILYEEQLQTLSILSTGIKKLDDFLDGGIYTGEITEVHGVAGSGKTQLCFSILSSLLFESDNTAVCLDSNGSFTSKRLEQILFEKSKDKHIATNCLKNVHIYNVRDIYHAFDILQYIKVRLCKENDVFYSSLKLIIFDSITPIIALHLGSLQFEGHGLMMTLAQELKLLSSEYALSILVCNNMVQGENFSDKPALGRSWAHVPSVTVCICKSAKNDSTNERVCSLVKSCRKGTFGCIEFNIVNEGIS